ncbi:MAG: glycosyltransferase [Chitinophagales bacterium]|nr:glycosyltransferase [Chitinophagales bacterium]
MIVFSFIVILFAAGYVLLILYYLSGWLQLKEYVPDGIVLSTKVTVIVPARNEEKNIINLLNDLREQNYNKMLFEVIVVDDFSTDRTAEMVRNCNIENVKLISLKDLAQTVHKNKANKKIAIETAVHQATGELIITTDADCHVGNNWIYALVSYYEEHGRHPAGKPVMIAGMVGYSYDRSFLAKFQTLDFISLVGIAAASIKNGFNNLCNGANLAYTKEAFLAVNGYRNNDHIASGDDMMLMHKISEKYPKQIAFLKNKDSIVYTSPETDIFSFWHQRLRWTSKSMHYEDKRITAVLCFVYLFNLLIVVNLILGIFETVYLRIAMFQFLAKICADTIFTYAVAKFFHRENLLWYFLPMQIVHILYVLCIGPAGVFGKYQWKGREMKR